MKPPFLLTDRFFRKISFFYLIYSLKRSYTNTKQNENSEKDT